MWTDERLDERFLAIERRFDSLEAEMRSGFATIHADIASLRNTLLQVAFGIVGVFATALVAVLIALA